MEQRGFSVTYLQPDHLGRITPEQLEKAIRDDTILTTIMLANNVVGTLENIAALAQTSHRHGILFHTDAVQAAGHIQLNVHKLGVDFLSISAHKFHVPKGVGALYCRLPKRLPPLILGGGQERGERSGTENIPGIAAMAAALEECTESLIENTEFLMELRKYLIQGIHHIPGVYLTGDPDNRLPGLASFFVEGVPHSSILVHELGKKGICISSGSACSSSSKEASHVLQAMGYGESQAKCSLRFSLDIDNTREEIDVVLRVLASAVEQFRKMNLKL